MNTAITIAASDSSSGAGIQADLAVFRNLGVYGFCVVTNVTAQNSCGVHKIFKVSPRIIAAQIDAVTRDYKVDACKVGMLFFPQAVEQVAERIARREIPNVVLDPVIKAKNGEILLTMPALKRMRKVLIPKARLITPNREEAEILTGMSIQDISSARSAAKALVDMGAGSALVKGGHLQGEPVDILYDGFGFYEFPGKRLDKRMHGTGCVLSAAIAAKIAQGMNLVDSVQEAKAYVSRAIENSVTLGKGNMYYYF